MSGALRARTFARALHGPEIGAVLAVHTTLLHRSKFDLCHAVIAIFVSLQLVIAQPQLL